MRRCASIFATLILGTALAAAQDFSVYPDLIVLAEKEGADLGCEPVPDARSLEVLSPVLPRGGHLTLVLVVRAKAGTGFAVDVGLNPKDRTLLRLFRFFPGTRYANSSFAQPLQEAPLPLRGRIGEGQRCAIFLLDVEAKRDVPMERVKVEPAAWLEGSDADTGWSRYPLEVRIGETRTERETGFEECDVPLETVARAAYLGAEKGCRPVQLSCKPTMESTVGSLLTRQLHSDFPIPADRPACSEIDAQEPLIPGLLKARAKAARGR